MAPHKMADCIDCRINKHIRELAKRAHTYHYCRSRPCPSCRRLCAFGREVARAVKGEIKRANDQLSDLEGREIDPAMDLFGTHGEQVLRAALSAEGTVSPAPSTHTADGREILRTIQVSARTMNVVRATPCPFVSDDESMEAAHGLVPEGRTPPQDYATALADLVYARTSHLEWAEHLEAHVASGTPCEACEGKPYKLNAEHEREWVAKYDRLIKIVRLAASPGAGPAPPDDVLDIYVPGRLRCPQCAFELTRARMSAATGEIGMGKSEVYMQSEPCPNDGTPMARVTWQQEAASNQEYAMRLIADILAASGADSLPAALAQLKAGAGPATQDGWRPIETAPTDEIVDFWIVPKLPEESYTDTSGHSIFSTGPSHRHTGRLKTWGSLYKATHWRRQPDPPSGGQARTAEPTGTEG